MLQDLIGALRASRFFDLFRTDERHARFIARQGKRVWRRFPDLGISGTPADLEEWISTKKGDLNDTDVRGNTVLLQAARANNLRLLEYLLTLDEVDKTKKNSAGYGALVLAIKNKHAEAVEMLAASGFVKLAEDQLEMPLHVAIEAGSVKIVRVLVKNGANLQRRCVWTGTPLRWALVTKKRQMAQVLFRLGARLAPGERRSLPTWLLDCDCERCAAPEVPRRVTGRNLPPVGDNDKIEMPRYFHGRFSPSESLPTEDKLSSNRPFGARPVAYNHDPNLRSAFYRKATSTPIAAVQLTHGEKLKLLKVEGIPVSGGGSSQSTWLEDRTAVDKFFRSGAMIHSDISTGDSLSRGSPTASSADLSGFVSHDKPFLTLADLAAFA